jgi:hypothetical protein
VIAINNTKKENLGVMFYLGENCCQYLEEMRTFKFYSQFPLGTTTVVDI